MLSSRLPQGKPEISRTKVKTLRPALLRDGLDGAGDLRGDLEPAGQLHFDFRAALKQQHHTDFPVPWLRARTAGSRRLATASSGATSRRNTRKPFCKLAAARRAARPTGCAHAPHRPALPPTGTAVQPFPAPANRDARPGPPKNNRLEMTAWIGQADDAHLAAHPGAPLGARYNGGGNTARCRAAFYGAREFRPGLHTQFLEHRGIVIKRMARQEKPTASYSRRSVPPATRASTAATRSARGSAAAEQFALTDRRGVMSMLRASKHRIDRG